MKTHPIKVCNYDIFKLFATVLIEFKDEPLAIGGYGASWIIKSLQSSSKTVKESDPRKELERYLDDDLEEVDNPVKWWGVSFYHHCSCFFFLKF